MFIVVTQSSALKWLCFMITFDLTWTSWTWTHPHMKPLFNSLRVAFLNLRHDWGPVSETCPKKQKQALSSVHTGEDEPLCDDQIRRNINEKHERCMRHTVYKTVGVWRTFLPRGSDALIKTCDFTLNKRADSWQMPYSSLLASDNTFCFWLFCYVCVLVRSVCSLKLTQACCCSLWRRCLAGTK